ncbi:hypothetical protein [Enterobacter roggenkampii]|uniref:hypothetical protein n=1 Tax=Enterobacter roggenkampii TaxID=1812935 RepID=UPI00195F068E|nr:hypothetical protein [Enterobacter roggenkampii]MBM7233147.1 hypothetical protein [Enterobacter roggenkampii]
MDHLLWHENWHRHAYDQRAEPVDFPGQLQQAEATILCLFAPPVHIGLKAAQAPLFEFAHHGSHPTP